MRGQCQAPNCPNDGREMWTETVDLGDECGPVLREFCADCLDAE